MAGQKPTCSTRRKNAYAPVPATMAAKSCAQARTTGDPFRHPIKRKGENLGQLHGTPANSYVAHIGNRPERSSETAKRRAGSKDRTMSAKVVFCGCIAAI